MSPREEKARQLLAELAEFLRTGTAAKETEPHLDAIVALVRASEFDTPVDGYGDITIPLAGILQIEIGPEGLGFGVSE